MFKKVLIAEDLDSVNFAATNVLTELGVQDVHHAQYCDKALLMVKKALQENLPFELLICDLSFKKDHREEKIQSGRELIAILEKEAPDLKVLVNSIEDHPHTIKTLWEFENVRGYVCKDRNGMKELQQAILALSNGETYNSPVMETAMRQENLFILNDFEINLLNCIAKGFTQDEIRVYFKSKKISPNSKSSIEKRLKELREEFNANTTPHLIGIVKDLKLI